MNQLLKFLPKLFYGLSAGMTDNTANKKNDFQLLVNSVKDYAIIMLDANGNVSSWNSGAAHIKGYTAKEIIGRPFEIFYTREDIENGEPADNLRQALQNGHLEKNGWRLRKNGSAFMANVVFTALMDDTGKLFGYSKIIRDITEARRAQEQLEIFSRQINQSNDSIYTVDPQYKITSWNRGAEKLYGFTKEEAIGKIPNELLQTNISSEELAAAMKEIHEKGYWSGDLMRKTKAGEKIYVHSSTSHLEDSAGVITGYIGVSFDITARKKLQQQVDHLASIVEQSTDAIRSIGLDERIISWNSGCEALHGYTKEEAIGNTSENLGIIRVPAEERAAFFSQVIKKGFVKSEMQFFHKNGSSFFGTLTASALKDNQGKVHSLVFMIKDISIRKQLEDQLKISNEELEQKVKERTEEIYKTNKRFRALVENDQAIISLLDNDLQPIYLSPASERITGWSQEERKKIAPADLLHPDDIAYLKTSVNKVLENPGKTIDTTLRTKHKNGHFIWLEGGFTNMLHDPGVGGIISNLLDVTERKASEEKIKKLNEDLEESVIKRTAQLNKINEELEAFSYSVSHDLRAPLHNIMGFTAILEEEYSSKLDAEAKRITSIIKKSAVRMGHLIDALLSFSRTSRQDIIKTTFNTSAMVNEIIKELEMQAGGQGTTDWVIHPLPRVRADVTTIRQVWINLISNAVKYTSKVAAPRIEIGSFLQDNELVFYLKDNGAGFNQQYKNKLFKVFQRLHGQDEFEGTGIGLAIVEKIISKHDGNVWAEAAINKGAVFYFSLPADSKLNKNSNNEKPAHNEFEHS